MVQLRHAILCESITADSEGIVSIMNIVRELGERTMPWESAFFWVFWIDGGAPNENVTIQADVMLLESVLSSQRVVVPVPSSGLAEGFLRLGPVRFEVPGTYTFRVGIPGVRSSFEWKGELVRRGQGSPAFEAT
jgi:hypothetical protein